MLISMVVTEHKRSFLNLCIFCTAILKMVLIQEHDEMRDFFLSACCESRISYGLSGHHQCKLANCSQNCGLKAIIRLHRKLSALDMMGVNCPCKFGGLIPLTNIAALIQSMTHFCSQLSSGRGKHAY